MPYEDNSELPNYVKKYGEKIRSQWRHVFNSTFKKTNSEKRAFMAANSVLKKRFEKTDCMLKNSREDYFNRLMDDFLGNLTG